MSELFNRLMKLDGTKDISQILDTAYEAAKQIAHQEAGLIKAKSLIEHKDAALAEAAEQFAKYELNHRAKAGALSAAGDKQAAHDSTVKADANRDYANLCRNVAAEAWE